MCKTTDILDMDRGESNEIVDLGKLNEPHHEKTCLMAFRPGLTLNGLNNYRRWIKAVLNFLIYEVEGLF